MKPEVLVRIQFPSSGLALLEKDFLVHYAPTPDELAKAIDTVGANIRAVVTNGSIGLKGEQMRALPKLEMILTQGVGYENVDMETATALRLVVTTGKGTNAFSVADHAIGLMLAVARNIVWADKRVREGAWLQSRGPRPVVWRKRLGILGLGEIGLEIARRAAGFDMPVRYHNRRQRTDVGYVYKASPVELAADSDFLVVAMPGGPGTRGLVGREVLDALGPRGYLINVGRGTVVDTDALVDALQENRIAGAALDVVAGEPQVPERLLTAPNLILTPHIASRSPESVAEAMKRISDDLKAHFAGEPLVSRVA